ncbi:dienelactone hydrolase family protein [Sphingomonas sp. NBWT7]|uniref:dienelactone hydrolase family protein n=1 Tax=Sphingomonas sp. NBWT7 TaxID=2596913 RepID=UPI001629B307|nr:dienelactone hydrolase family protein [Sphingomonas sp. NBWT7]QNE30838.1 dienelactone hydrolase family protein [Sphingomonas sp. NBWT7]
MNGNENNAAQAGETIRMTMRDGAEIAVYHAKPNGERRGGVVLLQEIFGVTDHIREMADDFASEGYEVLSPALFDREHPGFEASYTGPDFERAVELARKLHPFDLSVADTQTCIDALAAEGPVFVIGYCYGGSLAWAAATKLDRVAAASAYYGSMVPQIAAEAAPRVPVIAHFGRFDHGIPMEGVEAVIAKDFPLAEIYVYEAGHGFNSDRRKDYHEPSADLARERTLALFRANGS